MRSPSFTDLWSATPWQVFAAVIALLPLGGLGAARLLSGGGPRSAVAVMPMPAPPSDPPRTGGIPAERVAFDPALSAAYDRAAAVELGASPIKARFHRAGHAEPLAPVRPLFLPEPTPAAATPPATSLPTSLAVTTILASPLGNRAVVGGKLRTVGDQVAPGWTVEAIDPDAGTVTCVDPEGVRNVLRIKRPGRD